MKLALAIACLAVSAFAAETKPYPLWDGKESVANYAQRVNLPATKTIDLGNSVNLELVLIPAGKFVMGTPMPVAPRVALIALPPTDAYIM